jgi:hypothetical protein
MLAKLQANRESDQEELKGMINANLKDLKDDIRSNQAEMRSTVCAMRSELKEIIQHEMKAIIQPIWSEMRRPPTTKQQQPNPEMMKSIEEHEEIPKEDATVMPVIGLSKQHRVCNLAAEHHQKIVDLGGSQLLPAGRCPAVQK